MLKKGIKFKIYILCSFLLATTLVVGGIGFVEQKQIVNEYSYVANRNLPNIKTLSEIVSNYRMSRVLVTEISKKSLPRDVGMRNIESYEKLWNEIETLHKIYFDIPFAPGEDELYQPFKEEKAHIKTALDSVVSLYRDGISSGAIDYEKMDEIIGGDVRKYGDLFRKSGQTLLDFHINRAAMRTKAAEDTVVESETLMLIVISLGAVLGGIFTFVFTKNLIASLLSVSESLKDSSFKVSAGATQIASTSQELSQANTEQSASLEQTAASIEELNSMVRKSADNARKTYEVSSLSKNTALEGKNVVSEMIRAIEEINTSNTNIMHAIDDSNKKMESIVLVIREIGEKTKVINDIVFQTKLLSFNASVEAARAGEMGKGFSVVAEEVGNLAQMSGRAANDITSMLDGSITKVNEIVVETKSRVEHLVSDGKQKVETGRKVAIRCREVLDEIVGNVENVNGLASEISSASEEQARGIEEISKAANMLESVTQQNTMASEEASVAAESLSNQAELLNGLVQELVVVVNGGANKSGATSKNVYPINAGEKKFGKNVIDKLEEDERFVEL